MYSVLLVILLLYIVVLSIHVIMVERLSALRGQRLDEVAKEHDVIYKYCLQFILKSAVEREDYEEAEKARKLLEWYNEKK